VFARSFGCRRVLHRRDLRQNTIEVEMLIDGDDPVTVDAGIVAIPVPGHTRGSMVLLVDDTYLFTGDHLWWEGRRLAASRGVCWYSWPQQLRSLKRLLDFHFEWVLPGHGRHWHAPSRDAMRDELESTIRRLKEVATGPMMP
jgi:glyoxylase-like metal-dependent hydrolase (beta-lactamase superfamily II)